MSDGVDSRVVHPGETLIRLINKNHYDGARSEGVRIQVSHLRSTEFEPPEKNQPSVFVESACSLAELEQANPNWRDQGVVKVQASQLTDLGLEVRMTPEQCTKFTSIAHSHASIYRVTGENRQAVPNLFNKHVVRAPASR